MIVCHQLDRKEHISMKFYLNSIVFIQDNAYGNSAAKRWPSGLGLNVLSAGASTDTVIYQVRVPLMYIHDG